MCQHGLRTHVPTCQRAKIVPTSHFYVPINAPTCQSQGNFSTWCANLTNHVAIFQLRLLIFHLFFKRIFSPLNFSIMLNTCKFQEYLGNSRKFISRNKKFNFDICKISSRKCKINSVVVKLLKFISKASLKLLF